MKCDELLEGSRVKEVGCDKLLGATTFWKTAGLRGWGATSCWEGRAVKGWGAMSCGKGCARVFWYEYPVSFGYFCTSIGCFGKSFRLVSYIFTQVFCILEEVPFRFRIFRY